MPYHDKPPLFVRGGAQYLYSKALAKEFTSTSRFGDPYPLHRVVGQGENKRLLLPRNCVAPGGKDRRSDGLIVEFDSLWEARNPEQKRVVDESTDLLFEDRSHIVRAKPGFGKTACSCEIISRIGRKTLIVVTKEDVRDQWIAAVKKFLGLEDRQIGLIQGDKVVTAGCSIVIGMIHSLSRPGKYPQSLLEEFGLIVWDEVHRLGADHFSTTAWMFPAKLRLGLSATPKRTDGKDELIYAHIGPVLVTSTQMDLVPTIVVERSGYKIPLWRKRNRLGAWVLKQMDHYPGRIASLVKIMGQDKRRNAILVNAIVQAYNRDRKIIVFSSSIAHLETLYDLTVMRGVPEESLSFYIGGLKGSERIRAAGKRILFATYQFCSEATDIPALDTAVLATPMSQVEQVVGRILRTHAGKKKPMVFDLVDDDSRVLMSYYQTRRAYYQSIGAAFKEVG